ncbi:uncharacterized protein LOC132742948 [Ruditapes philippinarum]|uniref:uncharacterized protein LOC132742948 n=1 Tax=Ruditapes philippinarum TaxID=129788 RepID=UPI00295BAAE8|nr:uncharacterized protein LOC132742948 [Ruditapes philippinarum]
MKQKKQYLEKENEEKTAQTLGTVREDYLPIEIYSRSNQAWPKCDTQSPEQNIGQKRSSYMSETSKEKLYEVKKVGKSWLLGKPGGKLYVCPLLSNATEVEISDNFIEADDKVYEIKEDEFEQVCLVSVEEIPIYNQHNSNREPMESRQRESSSPSLISQRRSRGWFQSHQQETLPQYAENLNEMTITDGSEIGKNEDQYYLLEAGQTEDSSLIEVAFPAKQ